jgi:hypothetical protein
LGLLTALPGLLLTTLLTALSRLLTLLARLLLSAATLLATLTALLTALVLLARFLFVRIHKCSFVGLPTDNETMAIKFPFDFGTQAYTRLFAFARIDVSLGRIGVSRDFTPQTHRCRLIGIGIPIRTCRPFCGKCAGRNKRQYGPLVPSSHTRRVRNALRR